MCWAHAPCSRERGVMFRKVFSEHPIQAVTLQGLTKPLISKNGTGLKTIVRGIYRSDKSPLFCCGNLSLSIVKDGESLDTSTGREQTCWPGSTWCLATTLWRLMCCHTYSSPLPLLRSTFSTGCLSWRTTWNGGSATFNSFRRITYRNTTIHTDSNQGLSSIDGTSCQRMNHNVFNISKCSKPEFAVTGYRRLACNDVSSGSVA